jgi:thioredoxin reductase (NADPH)
MVGIFGYRDGILGPDLMAEMRFGPTVRFEIVQGNVTAVDLRRGHRGRTQEAEYTTRTLIIATGASAKLLGLPAERQLMGHGISTCATCDGYFFRGHDIAVVGGGDSAMEEAVFLTRFADKVTLVHRREGLRASKIMQDKARANPKISVDARHRGLRHSGQRMRRRDINGRA